MTSSTSAAVANLAVTASVTDVSAAVAARLSDLDLRRGVNVESEAIQRTSPSAAPPAASAVAPEADNFLTLKNVKGGFCLDKKLEKKMKNRSSEFDYQAEPWLRPQLDLDDFDYDFTLERSVLRDYN